MQISIYKSCLNVQIFVFYSQKSKEDHNIFDQLLFVISVFH